MRDYYSELQAGDRFGLEDPWELDGFGDGFGQQSDELSGFMEDKPKEEEQVQQKKTAAGKNRKKRKKKKQQKAEDIKIKDIPVEVNRNNVIEDENLLEKENELWEKDDEQLDRDILLGRYRNTCGVI